MPFLSKDWRDPGDQWVRYDGGWEKRKTLSNETSQLSSSYSTTSTNDGVNNTTTTTKKGNELVAVDKDGNFVNRHMQVNRNVWLRLSSNSSRRQPFCQITLKNTPEVAGANGLADALIRLDFISALADMRRFSYVTSLMHILFSHERFRMLSGASQRILFKMLEVTADQVYFKRADEHVLRSLLEQLHTTLAIYNVWGSYLGSASLFNQHAESRRKITDLVERMQTEYKQDLASPGLTERLPEECVREILLRLDTGEDIVRAGDACALMGGIAKETRIWRELVQSHFTPAQIAYVVNTKPQLQEDWEEIYKRSRRKFGLRETYTEMLALCRKCQSLFWSSIGHPCFVREHHASASSEDGSGSDTSSSSSASSPPVASAKHHVPVTPSTFLTFFSV